MKLNGIVILIILLLGLMLLSHLAPMLQEGLSNSGSTADAQYDYASDHYGNEDNKSNDTDSKDDTTVESDLIKTGTTLYGPNGEICQVLVNEKNKQYLEVRDSITKSPVYYNYDSSDVFKGPSGSIAEVFIGRDNQQRISIADRDGNTKVFAADGTQSDENSTNNHSNNNRSNHGSRMETNNYETVYSSSNYSSSLPRGLPSSQIVPGTEDLYILKTQVVPPVCPACARCPKPAFDRKKVPNYKSIDSQDSPFPVFNDFTSFGM